MAVEDYRILWLPIISPTFIDRRFNSYVLTLGMHSLQNSY